MCHALIGAYVHALCACMLLCAVLCLVVRMHCIWRGMRGEVVWLCGWWVKEVGNVQEWQELLYKLEEGGLYKEIVMKRQ